MSEVLKKMREDLKDAMKTEVLLRKEKVTSGIAHSVVVAQKTVSRAIISMIPELNIKPQDATDDHIYKLLKKFISQQKERQLYIDKHIRESDIEGISASDLKKLVAKKIQELGDKLDNSLVIIAKQYLPQQASEEEIISWIKENIDFSTFKNKMQAMGPIMKQFKGADGNFVKNILLKG